MVHGATRPTCSVARKSGLFFLGLEGYRQPLIGAKVLGMKAAVRPLLLLCSLSSCTERPESRVDRLIAIHARDTPGAAVAVVRGDEVLFTKGYGAADLEYSVAITPRTVFYLASAGKQFTAFSVALLAAEGRLSLDDAVQKYVPELGLEQPVTIRQLLHHTAGLRDFEALLALSGTRRSDLVTQSDLLTLIAAQRELNFVPGTEHLYSNSGYTLLATVVERVTKQTFRQLLRERVFEPLGMTHSSVGDDPGQIIEQRADSYVRTPSGFAKVVAPFSGYGSGGIYSTAEDLARWLGNFEQPRVGGPTVILQMGEQGVLPSGERIEYRFGLDSTLHRGLLLIGHNGDRAGYRVYVGRVPAHRLGIVVLANLAEIDACAIALGLMDVFLKENEKEPQRVPPMDGSRLAAYAGDYRRVGGGFSVRFTANGDELTTEIAGRRATLLPKNDSRFWIDVPCVVSGPVSFRVDPDGRIEEGTFLGVPIRRSERPLEHWSPSAEDLAAYAGRYYSPELGTTYTVRVADGGLVARHPRAGEVRLTPEERDAFAGSTWFFSEARFERNEARRVTGMRVSGFRVLNLAFERREP
jgi:CubicO group peptidase (beta-lactamase class C family)